MRNFNYITTTLFDSSLARFKLSVECRLTRLRSTDQTLEKLCYVDAKGNATLKPNIYLVFTYKGDNFEDNKALYTSYPQLFRIREAFEVMKDNLLSNSAYDDSTGILEILPEYKQPIVLSEIGKDKKWISFELTTITANEELGERTKGVKIEISGQSREVSVLTVEEFLNIYTIVKDIDLTSLQVQFATLFLLSDDSQQVNYGYSAPQAPQYRQNNNYYQQPQQQQYQQPYGSQQPQAPTSYNRAPQAPRYNNQPRAPQAPRVQGYSAPQAPKAAPSNLPPRQTSAPIVNLQAVEETPVDTTNWDDDASIESIFTD